MQRQPSGQDSAGAALPPEMRSGVWPLADQQPPQQAQQPVLQWQGSASQGQVPTQAYAAGSWQRQQPSDPRLRAGMQQAPRQAPPPVANQHAQQPYYQQPPAQPPPVQHTAQPASQQPPAQHWVQPAGQLAHAQQPPVQHRMQPAGQLPRAQQPLAQHRGQPAGQPAPAQQAGLPVRWPVAGAAAPPHGYWNLPAALDAHNVGRVLVGKAQLMDAVHLERALQGEASPPNAPLSLHTCVAHPCMPRVRPATARLLLLRALGANSPKDCLLCCHQLGTSACTASPSRPALPPPRPPRGTCRCWHGA